jgi:predicted SAM-dependent methyltransferase
MANKPTKALPRRQKDTKELFVNLGCGNHINEGKEWVNVDNFYHPEAKNFVKADIRELPFEANSVDYILCDQVLEHISMADIPLVLYEIRRVLKKGGRCVIMVPDFEGAVKQWLAIDHNGAFDPQVYHYYSEVIYGNQMHDGEYHKTPMCAGYLHFVLRMVGLVKNTITFWPANGPIPNIPGMRPYSENARLRNAQLVCDIIKT